LNDLKQTMNHQQAGAQETIDTLRCQLRESSSRLNESIASVEHLTASLAERSNTVHELNQKITLGETEIKTKVGKIHQHVIEYFI